MNEDRYYLQVIFDSKEVYIDRVRVIDGIVFYVLDDNTLGDSLGTGVLTYPTRQDAINKAKQKIEIFCIEMMKRVPDR